jgi:O-antigen chain-terminating methyltransferase
MARPPTSSGPDLDRILTAIREEATRRGATRRPHVDARALPADSGAFARRPALAGEPRHVRDYLALSSEALLDAAYRTLLNRPPDAKGAANYRRALRTGRRGKVEVLGRIRFSTEGRRHGVRVAGLMPALALALAYRVPVAGPLLAGLTALLRLPEHLRDRSGAERIAQETASELEG